MKYFTLLLSFLLPSLIFSQSNAEIAETVEIRRTTYGVPHILAPNLKAVAFGLAYCELEDYGERVIIPLIAARGDLGKLYGYAGLDNDFIRQLGYERAVQTYHRQDQDTRDMMEGFAAGVNYYLQKNQDKWPQYKDWQFSGYDVAALTTNVYTSLHTESLQEMLKNQKTKRDSLKQVRGEGSNSWAFAPSRTKSGKAILVRNPHLNWTAGYYEAQLTVPGKLNFYGDFRIGGVFAIIGGFNEYLGWSTTNNNPDLDELYALEADTNQIDHYILDGISFPLEQKIVTAEYKNGPAMASESKALWFTPFGPVVHRDEGKIYVLKRAGDRDYRRGMQYTQMLLSKNLEEWKAAMRMQGITQSNYMYADGEGNIFYVWNAAIPKLPLPSGRDTTPVLVTQSKEIWSNYISFDELPQLQNPEGGYLHNENDPFHFTNLNEVLSPQDYPDYFPKPRLRQRSQHSLKLIHNEDKLSLEDVVERKHSMGMLLADQIKPDLLKALKNYQPKKTFKKVIPHLEAWDNSVAKDSKGGLLFERWWAHYNRLKEGKSAYKSDWSFEAPMNTPQGLAEEKAAQEAMILAMKDLEKKYGTWDLAWGEVHRLRHGDVDLAVGGGPGGLGCFRVLWFRDSKDGKRHIRGGDGWQLAVEFSDPPRAYSVLAYGQSNDPESEHHTDQATLFANNQMKKIAFTEADIKAQLIKKYKP